MNIFLREKCKPEKVLQVYFIFLYLFVCLFDYLFNNVYCTCLFIYLTDHAIADNVNTNENVLLLWTTCPADRSLSEYYLIDGHKTSLLNSYHSYVCLGEYG